MQEHWSRLPCPPPGNLPDPGTESASLMSLALAGGFFTTSTNWKACIYMCVCVCVYTLKLLMKVKYVTLVNCLY